MEKRCGTFYVKRQYQRNPCGDRGVCPVSADGFPVLRGCGISTESELSEVFYLLSADRYRISCGICDLPYHRSVVVDLSGR